MGRSPGWLPCALYAPLAALGATLAFVDHGTVFVAPHGPRFAEEPAHAQLLGLGLALLVIVLTLCSTRWLVARARWARALHVRLRGALLGVSSRQLLVLALCSAVAEELFFRAALLPLLGLWTTTLIFGLLHVVPGEFHPGWMLWAALMGLVFAALYVGSGSLLAPVIAHAAINFENMRYLCRHDPLQTDTIRQTSHAVPPRRL